MIILFGKEAGFPVDTALHDVLRDPGEFYAWAAWHDGCLIEKYSKLTPLVDICPFLVVPHHFWSNGTSLSESWIRITHGSRIHVSLS